jgi:hypothetical protein
MLDRWRLAIVLSLFGFLASAVLIVNGSIGDSADLESRLGWVINIACPAHQLLTQFFPYENSGTPTMLLLLIAQTVANTAIWFCAGAVLTRIMGK